MERYERIVFMDIGSEEAADVLDIIHNDGEETAIEYLAQWHYPGEHETSSMVARGSDDDWFSTDDGYILSWNDRLGYVGLEYDTEND